MSTNSKDSMQFILFSLVLLMIPLFIFPARFGLEMDFGSIAYSLIEIIFYSIVIYFMKPSASFLQLSQGVGLAFLYRIMLGSIFGLLLAIMYQLDFSVAMTLGVSRYMPGILIHVLAAPFIIRPFYMNINAIRMERPRTYQKEQTTKKFTAEQRINPKPITSKPKAPNQYSPVTEPTSQSSGFAVGVGPDANGFERAVKYLGEHHAVQLAMVVDEEGLTLATFQRGEIDPEIWAPYSLLFQESNEAVLRRRKSDAKLDQMRLSFQNLRIEITSIEEFKLCVLSEREDDDLLKIRIVQAVDMIRKYSSDRYGKLLSAVTEEQHVSNT